MSSTKSINDLASKLSFYTPETGSLIEKSKTPPEENGGLFSSVKSMFSSSSSAAPTGQSDEESAGLMNWASSKISDVTQTKERLTIFSLLAVSGVVCMILAFTFLPMIIISPHKFAMLFTIGSFLMLASFSCLRGHAAFFKHLASIERLPFSASYGLSLVGTLYCSMVMGSYILTMIFSGIQVIALAYFLVSYIPGGTGALTLVGGMMGSGIKSIFVR